MQDIPLYNARIIKCYDEYLREYHPELDMASILDYAGITTYQMEDEGHWLTQTQVVSTCLRPRQRARYLSTPWGL
jgi:hypothetical protein